MLYGYVVGSLYINLEVKIWWIKVGVNNMYTTITGLRLMGYDKNKE
jgi:hypothetical protein